MKSTFATNNDIVFVLCKSTGKVLEDDGNASDRFVVRDGSFVTDTRLIVAHTV